MYLDNDDTYLVTETPEILNIAMVKIPKITKVSRMPFFGIWIYIRDLEI